MISVCLATYNGGKFIEEQLKSVLSQLSAEDEVVVSDDGSRDDTLEIIKSLGDSRIVVVQNEKKHGFVGNFENALSHIHGDYVFFCDQDDIWMPNKVETALSYMKKYDLIVHDALLVDGMGRSMDKTYFDCMHKGHGFWANLWKTRFLGCCMVMKRCVIDYSLPFPQNVQGHDFWVGMLALTKYKIAFVNDILLHYRRHGNNLSPSSEKSNNSFFYKIFVKRIPLLINVIMRFIARK